jgi:hypothetical protein
MKNGWLSCAVVATTLLSSPLWAGDANSADASGAPHKQMLKDCMARQKAKDSTLSTDELKKACQDEIKMKADTPNQTTPTTKGNPAPQTANPTNPPQ